MRRIFLLFATILIAVCNQSSSAAADNLPFEPGHLELVSGLVAYRLGTEAWAPAERNYPVFEGIQLSTAPQAEAVIRIGPSDLHMFSDSELDVATFAERLTDLVVRQGKLNVDLTKLDPGEGIELELPSGTLWVLDPGKYVVDVGDGKSDQHVRILKGGARMVGDKSDQAVQAGDELVITADNAISVVHANGGAAGSAQRRAAIVVPAATNKGATPAVSDKDKSAPAAPDKGAGSPASDKASDKTARTTPTADKGGAAASASDQTTNAAQSDAGMNPANSSAGASSPPGPPPPAPPDTVATSAAANAPPAPSPEVSDIRMLDRYGVWQDTTAYGQTWFPTAIPADWAPYRFGHWASVPPWGWTWIDDQPWGFIPSHYGRWANIDGRWGWIPGNAAEDAVYAPALVTFIGDPNGTPVEGSDDPAVAWVPLGPDEAYWPWYDVDDGYIAALNAADVGAFQVAAAAARVPQMRQASAHAELANRKFMTAVGRGAFTHAEPVSAHMLHGASEHFGNAARMSGGPKFAAVHPTMSSHAATGHEPEAARTGGQGQANRSEEAHANRGEESHGGNRAEEAHAGGHTEVMRGGSGHGEETRGGQHNEGQHNEGGREGMHEASRGASSHSSPMSSHGGGMPHQQASAMRGGGGQFHMPAASHGSGGGRAPQMSHSAPSGGGGRHR
jgi:hypothetical protein